MWPSIAGFELKYQLKSPTFWVCFIIFLLLGFGAMAIPPVRFAGGNVFKNAPIAINIMTSLMSIFFMFVTTAFGANVILRDTETGFGPLLYTTRLKKGDYVIGRMLGAFLVCALCFLSVPLGALIGTIMPWIDRDTMGPVSMPAYLYSYFIIGLPSILFMVALFSTAATLTKSLMGSYLCAVGLFVLYFGFSIVSENSDTMRDVYASIEPFALGALTKMVRYWTTEDGNHKLPEFGMMLAGNRLAYIAIGLALSFLTYRLMRFDTIGASDGKKSSAKDRNAIAQALAAPLARPTFGAGHAFAIFITRTRFEVGQVFSGPVFIILMLLALVFTGLIAVSVSQLFGTDVYPVTRVMVAAVSSGFVLFGRIVAIFYSGELVWRERTRRVDEIIDATAIPNWAYIVPKAIALIIVLFATSVIAVMGDMVVQIIRGYAHFEFGKYLLWWVLPSTVNAALLAVLAIFVQSLSPNRFVGWGIMVLYIVLMIVANVVGFDHKLYLYAAAPDMPLSDMNGLGQFWKGWLAFKLYWTALAVALLVICHLLWRRGKVPSLKGRLALIPRRLKGTPGAILAVSLVAFAGLGAFNFYNTNILNSYYTRHHSEKGQADFEKTFTKVVDIPVPNVVDVKLKVDLYPHDLRLTSEGTYTLENQTAAPITKLYIQSPFQLDYKTLTITGARQTKNMGQFAVRLFTFDTPMQPGERRTLHFIAEQAQKGFGNDGITTRIVDNGTFLSNDEIGPTIGIRSAVQLQDKRLRKQYGLPPVVRMKKLEDPAGDTHNYIHASWTTSDITLSTVADQTPIAPGYLVANTIANGRRTSRFVSTVPILDFFSIQSAHYSEKHQDHNGIDLAVYYDKQHAYNVDGMLDAMATSLDYYQANFSPYQFKQARIQEFPTYATYAQSFANTIPFSEGIGFIADVRNPDKINYVTYVTAHEVGHQWWAHQIVGADKQGATSLSETLAQYSALMVMEKMYGRDQIRRFLKFELDTYLRSRQLDQVGELPLYRVENQQYIHYNKGSLVMYLLKDRLGEDKVNAALRSVLAKFAFKGAPYPRSTDLIDALRAQADPGDQALITDLFEKITLVDLRTRDAVVKKRADGQWDVTFTVEAHKYYANDTGKETEAPLDEPIDIGVFTAKPGDGKFNARDVLSFARQPIKSGVQKITVTVARKPTYVGVDPYNKWIDRDSDDNVAPVGS